MQVYKFDNGDVVQVFHVDHGKATYSLNHGDVSTEDLLHDSQDGTENELGFWVGDRFIQLALLDHDGGRV